MKKRIKLARVATVPFFLDSQLKQQMEDLLEKDFDITAVASPGELWARMEAVENLHCITIAIARAPAPFSDLISLFKLYRLFSDQGFDIVHSSTPKAGLLCAIAAKLAGTPIRLHTFTGQVWATKQGFWRLLLQFWDKLIVRLNTQCYTDSLSQRDFINQEGIGDTRSVKVLGRGSLSGVDLKRFNRGLWVNFESDIRQELELSDKDFIVTFVGRISREKGIYELVDAFESLKDSYPELHLVIVGPCEEDQVAEDLKQWCLLSNLHYVGMTDTPERYLSISNLLCLPSYREGFGTVVIEAAAMKVPTLGSRISGLSDAVEDGVTGILVESQSKIALQQGLEQLIVNRDYCYKLGEQAFVRCEQNFDSEIVTDLVAKEYNDQLFKR